MQPDIDAQLSNFFVEYSIPEFSRVMRGYDPTQVNAALERLDSEVRKHKENALAFQRELADAHRQIQEQERPTYSGLGSRIEQLLRPFRVHQQGQSRPRHRLERRIALADVGHA